MPPPPSAFEPLLGRRVTLEIRRFNRTGACLAEPAAPPDAPCLPLHGSEIPAGAHEGDPIDVFVYLDSTDQPIATTREPALTLGEVTFLTVTACTDVGAFFDWGLPKELLVPFAEHATELRLGARHPIGLYLDNSGRLAGTMHVAEMLDLGSPALSVGSWVEGEAWRNDPAIGLFVIIAKTCVGLVPRDEPHSLNRGQACRFRVVRVHPDGKVELSLRGHAHTEQNADAERVLELLSREGAPRVGDRSPPEQIRTLFGLSKKAFKRAVGHLLKHGLVEVSATGHVVPTSKDD